MCISNFISPFSFSSGLPFLLFLFLLFSSFFLFFPLLFTFLLLSFFFFFFFFFLFFFFFIFSCFSWGLLGHPLCLCSKSYAERPILLFLLGEPPPPHMHAALAEALAPRTGHTTGGLLSFSGHLDIAAQRLNAYAEACRPLPTAAAAAAAHPSGPCVIA